MLDKGEFLARQQSAGRVDSSGSFTVAWDKAGKKLAQSRLPRTTAWILKVVQAAVTGDAPELRIRQGRWSTEIHFEPRCLPTLEELLAAFARSGAGAGPSLEQLVTALSAVGPGQERPFTLVLKDSDRVDKIVWDGELSEQRDVSGFMWKRGITLNVRVGSGPAAPRNASEAEELRLYAHAAPCEIYLDSRRIDPVVTTAPPGLPPLRFHWPYSFTPKEQAAYLALGSLPAEESFSPFFLPVDLAKRANRRALSDRATDARPLLVQLSDERRIAVLWRLDFRFIDSIFEKISGPSYCRWLKDGVVILEEELPNLQLPLVLTLYLDAGNCDTDLSGFSFQASSEPIRAKLTWRAAKAVGEQLVLLRNSLQKVSPMPGLGTSMLVTGGTMLMTFPFWFWSPFILLGWGAVTTLASVGDTAGRKSKLLADLYQSIAKLEEELQAWEEPASESLDSPGAAV